MMDSSLHVEVPRGDISIPGSVPAHRDERTCGAAAAMELLESSSTDVELTGIAESEYIAVS